VIAPKLKSLEAERQSICTQLVAVNDQGKPVAIHPAAIKNYLEHDVFIRKHSLSF
jgi:hypothetical protein